MLFQSSEKRREALLALSRAAAVAIVHLHMREQAPRQPALHQRAERLLFHAPRRAAVEHGSYRGVADFVHDLRSLVERVDELRLLGGERLDAVDHTGLLCAL